MNQQFESMPFELYGALEMEGEGEWEGDMESEWESERGRMPMARSAGAGRVRGGGSGRAMAMRRPAAQARPGKGGRPGRPRPGGPGPRPRWPYYGPRGPYYYGGPLLPEPYPYPVQQPQLQPQAEPEPEPADNLPDEPDMPSDGQGEVPPTLAGTLSRLPPAIQPAYVQIGSVLTALRDDRATGAGFYLIEFTVNNQLRAYSGQTKDLRRRLQQHALCGHIMGQPLSGHIVYVAKSGLSEAQRRAIEWRIHDDMFRNQRGVLTNQRRELEVQLLGKEWD